MATESAYKNVGVDLEAAVDWTAMVKERIEDNWPEAAQEIGGFAGGGTVPAGTKFYKGGVDGTGTKIILAALLEEFRGIGQDAVAMATVDTYIEQGTPPIALWDVIDIARLQPDLHIESSIALFRVVSLQEQS